LLTRLDQRLDPFRLEPSAAADAAAAAGALGHETARGGWVIGDAERAWKIGVRASLLERWLGERWVDRCIRVEGNELSMSQVQQIVDSLLPDVPVERRMNVSADGPIKPAEKGFDLLVVDRDAFALELAREWVRTGLPRSPVR
jgi:hypothetical protein